MIKWLWKSSLGRLDSDEAAWTAYDDAKSAQIESAFQEGNFLVIVDQEYQIDFTSMTQARRDDPSRRRLVKRSPPYDGPPPFDKSSSHKGNKKSSADKPFALPFNIYSEGDYGTGAEPLSLVELEMMKLSAAIREKPQWFNKYKDATIKAKWRKEALEQFPNPAAVDYVLDELAYYDSRRSGSLEDSSVDGVWQSDDIIPKDLKSRLIDGVAPLENVPDAEKDWHPGSNNQVLDIVHPSLFCLIFGVSRAVPEGSNIPSLSLMNSGEVVAPPKVSVKPKYSWRPVDPNQVTSTSAKYAWLPSEFQIHDDGKVSIESYINNLHPVKYAHLYGVLGSIFERFVPLFNRVLTDASAPRTPRLDIDCNWYASSDEEPEDGSDWDERYEQYIQNRRLKEIEIPKFAMPEEQKKKNKKQQTLIDLKGKRVQVIVKLANIHLTPQNPEYPGGSWHIEGMENEQIVASGIYYYECANITESRLAFRQAVREPDYEQGDDRGVGEVYGLANEEALNQPLGSVVTKEDRCIAFPNHYQHQVQPFKLVDPTKPGYRKILVFFLVNPSKRIVSTASIPPQRQDWFYEAIKDHNPFKHLPQEITKQIVASMDFPLSMEQAKQYREGLMAERKYFVKKNNEELYERQFSLCEH